MNELLFFVIMAMGLAFVVVALVWVAREAARKPERDESEGVESDGLWSAIDGAERIVGELGLVAERLSKIAGDPAAAVMVPSNDGHSGLPAGTEALAARHPTAGGMPAAGEAMAGVRLAAGLPPDEGRAFVNGYPALAMAGYDAGVGTGDGTVGGVGDDVSAGDGDGAGDGAGDDARRGNRVRQGAGLSAGARQDAEGKRAGSQTPFERSRGKAKLNAAQAKSIESGTAGKEKRHNTPIKNSKYAEALEYAQQGLDSEEIARLLNMGKGEVSLILNLQKAYGPNEED